MLRLQMLPAGCGDCLWLEYGPPGESRIVIIDGGVSDTAKALRRRIETALQEREATVLEVELLVVTHIDNDHILGIIELLKAPDLPVRFKDIWFNGKPQLLRLAAQADESDQAESAAHAARPPDLMGDAQDDAADDLHGERDRWSDEAPPAAALRQPGGPPLVVSDLLGAQQADQLSDTLGRLGLPCNTHDRWNGGPVWVPAAGALPVVTLDGGLRLTLLGPTRPRLLKLCAAWSDVLGGRDEAAPPGHGLPADLLGRRDRWPPVWQDGEGRDPSAANGSSIMLLAEFDGQALLLAADGHAPDLAAALDRFAQARPTWPTGPTGRLKFAGFKLPHHGSEKNLSRAVLDRIDCCRYLISTDGSGHSHPDHQALLRILRYAPGQPRLLFNHRGDTTSPWSDMKSDVLAAGFQEYTTEYPVRPADGLVLELATPAEGATEA